MFQPPTQQTITMLDNPSTPSSNGVKYIKMEDEFENDEMALCEVTNDDGNNGFNHDRVGSVYYTSSTNRVRHRCDKVKRYALATFVFSTLILILLAFMIVVWFNDKPRDYKGHKVIKLMPSDQYQLSVIIDLEKKYKVDFWNEPYFKNPNEPILMQIIPGGDDERDLMEIFNNTHIHYSVVIEDLHEAIEEEKKEHQKEDNETEFNFGRYHTFEEILNYLYSQQVVDSQPNVKVGQIGKSFEGRDIPLVVIGSDDHVMTVKPVIIIDSLMHAKEWITGTTSLYIIDQLLHNSSCHHYMDKFEFHFIPMFNPDGYAYSWRYDRLWRKTRSHSINSIVCRGADANRNFDSHFCNNDELNMSPCEDNFCGDFPFSEPEVWAFRNHLLQLNHTRKIGAYFSLHSFKQMWLFPYAYTKQRPADYLKLNNISRTAVNAIKSIHGVNYKYGTAASTIYQTSGVSMDWVYDTLKVNLSFAIELRDDGHYGHLIPKKLIIPTAEETWAGIKATLDLIQ